MNRNMGSFSLESRVDWFRYANKLKISALFSAEFCDIGSSPEPKCREGGGEGVLTYIGYTGMCRSEA